MTHAQLITKPKVEKTIRAAGRPVFVISTVNKNLPFVVLTEVHFAPPFSALQAWCSEETVLVPDSHDLWGCHLRSCPLQIMHLKSFTGKRPYGMTTLLSKRGEKMRHFFLGLPPLLRAPVSPKMTSWKLVTFFFFFFWIFQMNLEGLFLRLTSHVLFHRAFSAVHLIG